MSSPTIPDSEQLEYWKTKTKFLEYQVVHYEMVIKSLQRQLTLKGQDDKNVPKKRGRPTGVKKGYVMCDPRSDFENDEAPPPKLTMPNMAFLKK